MPRDRQATRALNTNSKAWKLLRERVLVRDGYRCVACGKLVGGKREAHVDHINNDAADLASYTMDSLATMCVAGHSRKTLAEQQGRKWDGNCTDDRGCDADGWPNKGWPGG